VLAFLGILGVFCVAFLCVRFALQTFCELFVDHVPPDTAVANRWVTLNDIQQARQRDIVPIDLVEKFIDGLL